MSETMVRVSIMSVLMAGALTAFAGSAQAAYVDFRASGGPNGIDSWSTTADGVTMTVTSSPDSSVLYWDSTDGFGVNSTSYEDDEVEANERLIISFSEPVQLVSTQLTDLFYENGYAERGSYVLSNGQQTNFTALRSQTPTTNGERTLSINALTSSITYLAPGYIFGQNHEFSVAGITFNRIVSVPELDPASGMTALALIAGMVILVQDRRRRQALTTA